MMSTTNKAQRKKMAQPIKKEKQEIISDEDLVSSNGRDLISHMPSPIIHHILNLVPNNKDRTKTCILSRTWNHLFLTRPNLIFHEQDFNPEDSCISSPQARAMFVEYVHNSLNHCIENNSHHFESMEVKFSMSDPDGKPLSRDINMWLTKADIAMVRKVSLSMGSSGYEFKNLVLDSHKLVELHLGCLRFVKACRLIRLPNVKVLSLLHVDLRRGAMKKLIPGLPGVQFFHLSQCRIPQNLQLSGLVRLIQVTVSYCTKIKTVEITSPFFQNFLHLDHGRRGYNPAIKLLGCEKMSKLQLSTWLSNGKNNNKFCAEFKWLVELRLVCLVIKDVVCSQSVRKLLIRFCNVVKLGDVAEIDCPNLLSLEYEDNDMPFRFVSECYPKDLRYECSLPRNGRAMQIHSLQRLFATSFITIENLKVVIVLDHLKDVVILHGLIDAMISILNQIGDSLSEPKIFITTGSIDWNAVVPYPKVDRLPINVVSLWDSKFPKVVWEKLLSLKRNQIGRYAKVRSVHEDHKKENIPAELQQDQIAPYKVSRIILNFGGSMGKVKLEQE